MAIHLKVKKEFHNFSLAVDLKTDSRRIGILGPSGCGKSLTLKCIAGIERADEGQIIYDDKTLFARKKGERMINPKAQKRKVGYLFQNYALFPNMTVAENIAVAISGNQSRKKEITQKYIQRFQINGLEEMYPAQLSGGQQQRVALARILANEPEMILLDEPFSALDEHLKDQLQAELYQMLNDYPGTVIMVSHSRDEIYRFSEHLLVMEEGKTVCQGPTKDIFADPHYVSAARLTGCKNIWTAIYKDSHHLFLPSWETDLEFNRVISSNITHIGIRAHDFLPCWTREDLKKEENSIPITNYRMDKLPFEHKYYIESPDGESRLSWFVQREIQQKIAMQGMPDSLIIPEDHILLLEEGIEENE